MYHSFLSYRNAKYLRIALILCLISLIAYVVHHPQDPPNGGTWLGYTLGTVAALIILWLTWFGVRKRKYSSTQGTVQGWLSAHVYLGASLIVIATLHSGAQIGNNIHTICYLLMMTVIFSGFYGVYVYRRYPGLLAANRKGQPRSEYFEALAEVDKRCTSIATKALPDIQGVVTSAIERTVIGGNALAQILGIDSSKVMLPPGSGNKGDALTLVSNTGQDRSIAYLTDQLSQSGGGEETLLMKEILELFAKRKRILGILIEDIKIQARLQVWLYFHVPLTFALLASLIAHVISVFIYW